VSVRVCHACEPLFKHKPPATILALKTHCMLSLKNNLSLYSRSIWTGGKVYRTIHSKQHQMV